MISSSMLTSCTLPSVTRINVGRATAPRRTRKLPLNRPQDFVELFRSGCYGSCPIYTVRVSAKWRCVWEGQDCGVKTGIDAQSSSLATRLPDQAAACVWQRECARDRQSESKRTPQ